MSAAPSVSPLPTLDEVREVLGAILPLTDWLPPAGAYRVYDRLSPAHGNPDETRVYEGGGDDRARAYLQRQVERSDWQAWRERSRAPFARRAWPWTIGGALDPALVAREYPLDGELAVVLVEIPLITLDRSEVILRAQTQIPRGLIDDHELRFRRTQSGSWTRAR